MDFTELRNPEACSKDFRLVHRCPTGPGFSVAGGGLAEVVQRVRDRAQVRSSVAGGSLDLVVNKVNQLCQLKVWRQANE
jgi:hypothetical protein